MTRMSRLSISVPSRGREKEKRRGFGIWMLLDSCFGLRNFNRSILAHIYDTTRH